MRKLMIVAGALATAMSVGAMSTATAAEVHPAPKRAPVQTVPHVSNPLDLFWKHPAHPAPVHAAPKKTPARRDAAKRDLDHQEYRGTDRAQAPSRVADHDVRTPVQHQSNSHDSHNTNDKNRESARGDRR